jgi:hypothetical protein
LTYVYVLLLQPVLQESVCLIWLLALELQEWRSGAPLEYGKGMHCGPVYDNSPVSVRMNHQGVSAAP